MTHTNAAVSARPTKQAPNSFSWLPLAAMALSGMIQLVTNQNAISDRMPATARPL
ncbi:hypothetical protein D3C73_1651220 [compost metagenome]